MNVTTTFAPSELVLLNGETFAKKARLMNTTLLHSEADVSTEELARAILATAILANEQAGAVRLEVRTKKALFGLRSVQALYVEPTGSDSPWPHGSLEARVGEAARAGKRNKDRNEAAHVVSALLDEDTQNPWAHAISLVTAGLAERGVLEVVEKKRLKVFTSREYVLPAVTREAAAAEDVSFIQDWLEGTKSQRPEVWKLFQDHIKTAVTWRTESDDDIDID